MSLNTLTFPFRLLLLFFNTALPNFSSNHASSCSFDHCVASVFFVARSFVLGSSLSKSPSKSTSPNNVSGRSISSEVSVISSGVVTVDCATKALRSCSGNPCGCSEANSFKLVVKL